MRKSRYFVALIVWCLVLAAGMSTGIASNDDNDRQVKRDWGAYGQNRNNDHDNSPGTLIKKKDVANLVGLCGAKYDKREASGATNAAKPILVGDVLYWAGTAGEVGASRLPRDPDGNGVSEDCEEIWSRNVNDILGILPTGAPGVPAVRVSPAWYIDKDGKPALFYVGVSNHFGLSVFSDPVGLLLHTEIMFGFSLDATTGAEKWVLPLTPLDDTGRVKPEDYAISSLSAPAIHKGVAYFGFASLNNVFNGFVFPPFINNGLTKLSFRGQMVAVDLFGRKNGGVPFVKWKQFTLPPPPEDWNPEVDGDWFTGGGVWTSGASFLPGAGKKGKGLVFFGSGQAYSAPKSVYECLSQPILPFQIAGTDREITKKGETGEGAKDCYDQAAAWAKTLKYPPPSPPYAPQGATLAIDSIIALNAYDGTYAWHVPTAGMDVWQASCGLDADNPVFPCTVPVPGPDWDVGGSAPVLAQVGKNKIVAAGTKAGMLFVLNAKTGEQVWNADVCTGTPLGGIHFGVSYDRKRKTLMVPCSGGILLDEIQEDSGSYQHVLADGSKVCNTGVLNAIDIRTGKLKWQSVPARAITPADDPLCEMIGLNETDARFKFGLSFDHVHKNHIDASVPVHYMPDSPGIPVAVSGLAHSHGIPALANDVVYWPIYNGTLYALDLEDGSYLHQMHCRRGAMYGGPAVARNRVAVSCGEVFQGGRFFPFTSGDTVEVFAVQIGR